MLFLDFEKNVKNVNK